MLNKGILILICVCWFYTGCAQTDSVKTKPQYFNMFTSGMLIGCGLCNNGKDFTLSFSTHHGLAFNSGVRLSIGTGIDTYHEWRMIPLVLGITLDKGEKPQGVYFHVNAGHAFGRFTSPNMYDRQFLHEQGGFTISPMFGYRIGNERIRLYVQAGYKFQRTGYQLKYADTYMYSRSFEMDRVVMQMGFGFN